MIDGLVGKITYDFLLRLEKMNCEVVGINIQMFSKDNSSSYKKFTNSKDFIRLYPAIKTRNYLCLVGDYALIENIYIKNNNLSFSNEYKYFNIIDKRKLVVNIDNNNYSNKSYSNDIERYKKLFDEEFNTYINNAKNAVATRSSAYVDPCYVDAGYVSPN